MKTPFILLFLSFSLFAKSNESCYTVQLVSKYNSQKNLNLLNTKSFPSSCKLMEIGNSLTIRCGCFEKYAEAESELDKYKNEYKIAVIATTYKYRFDNSLLEKTILNKTNNFNTAVKEEKSRKIITKEKVKNKKDHTKIVSKKDEELRLILQVFLYKNDLENAYKVGTLGYEKYPNSYYWNQKMAEISKWTNRSARSMKHLRFMYDIKRDPKIEKELIEYGTSAYQYENIEPLVVNRARANPTEKNIDLMILVYKKIGSPEKVVKVLDEQYEKDRNNTMLLTKALQLSLEMGDLKLAKVYVDKIEANKPYSKKDASLIARYYYVTHDMQKSYASLNYVVDKKDEREEEADHIKYYELKSDLGWYLQDNEAAALASKHLMDIHKARLVDYERVSFVYQKSNPQLASYATRLAYEKYKLSYLFYSYANGAINSKNYDELNALLQSIEKESTPLVRESLYWMIKAKVYAHYKEHFLEEEALYMANAMEPNNYQIKLELLWLYMDLKDDTKLKQLLDEMSENLDLDSSYYLPLASAYFYLGDVNRASYYTNELLLEDDPATEFLEFKFLQAYIYQIQNNEEAFKSYMQDIVSKLKRDAKENPQLKQQNKYLSNYLRAAMFVLNPDKFEKKLKKAKKYLTKKNYNEIAYSWAMRNNAYEKTLKIYHKMSKKELWVNFSNAILFQKHTELENILDIYLHSLSMGDASQVAEKDGQVALAQTITFEGLLNNEKNQNAYIHHLDLSKERTDKFSAKGSYYNREPLLQKYIRLQNQTYLQDSYYFLSELAYYKNETLDEKRLVKVPNDIMSAKIGLKRLYNRGFIEGDIAYHDAMRSYMEYVFDVQYRLSTDLYTGINLAHNRDAIESTQLLLGGKKDMIAPNLRWSILQSTSVNFLYEYNRYYSQDDVHLGNGHYGRVSIIQEIRNGYPDLKVGAFYDRGISDETEGTRGVIDELQADTYPVLPNSFYNAGVTFAYGMANSDLYTRVWRPYIEFYPYYNSETDSYTFGFNAGYGGKIWHQDHLIFGASYTESVNGIGGSVLELFVNYKFMYYHP